MKKDELKKGVKELVIALLKCKPTKDKEIIDFNVRAFMGGFEDYLSNQSVSDEEIEKWAKSQVSFGKDMLPLNMNEEYLALIRGAKWMRDTPTPITEEIEVCNEDFLDSFLKYVDKTTWGKDKDVTNSQVINHFLINYPPIKEEERKYKCNDGDCFLCDNNFKELKDKEEVKECGCLTFKFNSQNSKWEEETCDKCN